MFRNVLKMTILNKHLNLGNREGDVPICSTGTTLKDLIYHTSLCRVF